MANAMEYPEASKIALATIADYLWDPSSYHPDQSWPKAIAQVAGEADAVAMTAFADNVRASCLSDPEPIRLTAALQRFAFEVEYGDADAAGHQLSTFAVELGAAADHLLGDAVENRALLNELRPWLTKFRVGAAAVNALAMYATTAPISETGREVLAAYLTQLRSDPYRVFGDVLEMTIADLITADGNPAPTPH
jgi:hyaluronoglucosaminidase